MRSNDNPKSKMEMLLAISQAERSARSEIPEEQKHLSVREIITDGLSDLAERHGWGVDDIRLMDSEEEVGVYDQFVEPYEFTFSVGSNRLKVIYDLEIGTFVGGSITSELSGPHSVLGVFEQLGTKR